MGEGVKTVGDVFHRVKDFLFSRANREFLIFLFFFAISGIFWLLMTLNETYEQELRIPVYYEKIPKTAVLTSAETDTIRVTVRDKGIVLLTYLYGDALRDISVDFPTYAKQNDKGIVPASVLSKKVMSRLLPSSKIVSIKPEQLVFYYNFGERKRVPVKRTGKVTAEKQHFISKEEILPDSVTIYASSKMLSTISAVYTEPLKIDEIRDTLTVKARLQKMEGVKMVPEIITVRFATDVLAEAHIGGIPIRCINIPEGKILRTFPAKASVKFVAGVSTIRSLSPLDFSVVVDYNEIRNNQSPKCNVILQVVPAGVSRATLEVKQVDYLIEEQDMP